MESTAVGHQTPWDDDRLLLAQAQALVYARHPLPCDSFNDGILQQLVARTNDPLATAQVITRSQNDAYLEKEFRKFQDVLKTYMHACNDNAGGNQHCQLLFGTRSLQALGKFLVVALRTVDPNYKRAWTVCVNVLRVSDSVASTAQLVLHEISEMRGVQSPSDILTSSLRSACSPALEHELGLDLMPSVLDDIDAIYRYGAGVFVRKQGDMILNPFHECVQVINTARNIARFFSFRNAGDARMDALRACCEKHDFEFISLPRRTNVDQIGSVHTLLWKLISMETPLTQFLGFCRKSDSYNGLIDCKFLPVFDMLTGTFFQHVREIEAVLHILMFRKDLRDSVAADADAIVGGFGAVLIADVLTRYRCLFLYVSKLIS